MTEDILFLVFSRSKNFCIRSPDTKKVHVYAHNFSVSFFSSLSHCLVIFSCLITYVQCFKVIWYISWGFWFIFNRFFTHPFRFKTIRSSVQPPWFFFNDFFSHFLCLKMVRDMPQCFLFSAYCLSTYLFCLKMVWYIF